jgi:hypothetical protein
MIRLAPYIALILLGGGAVWYVMDLREQVATHAATVAGYKLRLDGCENRAENLDTERQSDEVFERFEDDDLRNLPAHWLRRTD